MTAEILNRKSTYTTGSSMVARISSVPVQKAAFTPFVLAKAVIEVVYHPVEPSIGQQHDDLELTRLSMSFSEPSLAEGWQEEDDEKWNSFLNA
ncbi:MAG: hypothetical protein EOP48_08845 [Sphingobacteriales bacterium]|nr:MAG: hypothetical protein EOP48_08845 [Sphingobacteriales bacterium]